MAHALTIPTHETFPFKSSYQCFESPPSYQPRTGRPTVPDCTAAIDLLPNKGAHLGRFHIDGDDDDYRLPFDTAMGSCEVGIKLVDGAREDSSIWGELSLRASWLNHACVSMGFYGGYTYAGKNTRIKITINHSAAEESGGSKAPAAEAVESR